MAEGIIDSLIEKQKINDEIKSMIEGLTNAQNSLKSLSDTAITASNNLVNSIKKMKEAVNFTELSDGIKENIKAQKELQAVNEKRQSQEQKMAALEKQLADYNKKAAVEMEELRLQIAEKNREAKNEAQALIASKKAMDDWGRLVTKQSGSIKELTVRNKELREVRDNLNTDADKQKIEQLNKIIDGNTATIKLNQDSYVKQKMDIGDYEIALEGVREQILLASKAIQEMADKGDTQSDGYLDLMKNLEHLNKLQGDYTNQITEGIKAVEPLKSELNDLKKEMTELHLIGKDNWSEDQKKHYADLSEEAVRLQYAINAANAQVQELAANNIELRGMTDALSTLTATSQLYDSVLSDLGVENKSYQEILVNLQSAQATINSLETLSNKLKTNSVMMIGLQRMAEKGNTAQRWLAVQAQNALNAAQKAMPYVAIAAAFLYVGKAIFDYAMSTSQAIKDQKMFNDIQKESVDLYGKQAAKIEVLSKQVIKGNLSIKQQNDIIISLNKVVAESGQHFKTWEEAEQFLIKDKDKYIQAMAERAYQQQLINEYTNIYIERQKKLNTGIEINFWNALVSTLKHGGSSLYIVSDAFVNLSNDIDEFTIRMNKILEKINDVGSLGDDSEKAATELVKALNVWNNTEIYNLTIKYNEEKALLEKHGKDTALLTNKYNEDVAKINKKTVDEQRKIIETIIQLRIDVMSEGKDKELAALKSAQEKEIAAVTGTTKQSEEQITLINEIYRKKREEIKNKYTEAELQAQVDAWQLKLDIAEKGSKQEYTARINILEVQRKMEVEAATKTGADVNDINAYYDQQALAAFSDFVDAKITKAQEEADARTRMAGEAAAAEEAALLERWKNGEINEEQYNKAISDIRHKYSVQSIEDEINAFKQLLDNEKLTAEQRREIEKKLYDAKKALSDEETSHEIENIKKVEEQRKKATQMAKDLAKQAFDMAMEFLTMQSEAKVAELDEELERIDELMNKELEALDNAVMSDETRAAEEKRIRAQAKADSDRVEEEKRKEQQKQAAYQKTSSIVQAIINTAQGITAALTIPVAGIALAAVVGALGAAQIAMIAAQPLPKYARGIYGDEEHPGGPAIVGDARKREYVLTPEGKLYETPAVPTLVDMEKGAQVFPDYRTMMQYFRPEIPKYTTSSTAPDLSRSIDRLEHAIKESKSVQHVSMNLDKNGIWLLSMNGKRNIRYINSRINQ